MTEWTGWKARAALWAARRQKLLEMLGLADDKPRTSPFSDMRREDLEKLFEGTVQLHIADPDSVDKV